MDKSELETQKTEAIFQQGKETYHRLKEAGLNLIAPRAAVESLDPNSSRTLMDLLGESAHRSRNLIALLVEEESPSVEKELEFIRLSWEGFETAAKESEDEEVAQFVRDVFIDSIFGGEDEGTPLET